MDLRQYYQEIREVEQSIPGKDVVIVSLRTPEGGKAGLKTEVARYGAARMVCDKRARLATPEETEEYHAETHAAFEAAQSEALAQRVQVVIADSDVRAFHESRNKKQ